MAINFLSSIDITGTASLSSVSNDNSSYTGILVWDGGLLKYRTKSQLLTDIGGDINNYVSSISFNTTNGILSLPRTGLSTLTVDLDGRYALASDNVDGSGTTNFVAKWLDSNTIQDSVIFDNGTNVGIGTASPNEKLEVDGNIRLTDYNDDIQFGGTANALSYNQWLASASGGMIIKNSASASTGHIAFQTSEGEKVRILRDGNVGIGTTSPSQKLEVALGTSSGSDGIFIKGYFAGGSSYIDSKKPFISLGTSTSNTYTSTIYLGASATATDQDSKIEWSKTNNALSIYHKGQGTYREHVRFGDPSSSIAKSVFFGNVGIGVTSPSARLDVSNAGMAAKFVSTQNTGLSVQGGANSQDLAIFKNPGGITELVIKSTGNVGIGNNFNTPSERLEVSGGNLKVSNTGTPTLILNSTNSTGAKIQALKNGSASPPMGELSWNSNTGINLFFFSTSYQTNSLQLDGSNFIVTNTGSERMRINSSGNVGIGTTSPDFKLDVNGDVRIEEKHYLLFGGVGAQDANWIVQNTQGGDFSINEGFSGVRFFIENGGNLGIGTTTPSQKLDVNGNVQADTLIATDLTDGVIPYHRNNSLGLQDQKMFSDNTNIYIGPSSPPNYYSRLTVEGSGIYTTDIEISGSLTYQEPTAASEFNGEIATFGTFIETPAAGDLICFNNSLGTSGWREANNSSNVDSTGMLGIAIGTTPTSGILLRGFARSALYNTTNLGTTPAGKKLYIDSTNGLLTTVIPTSNYVRIVGYVVEADATDGTIYFCPDNTYIDI